MVYIFLDGVLSVTGCYTSIEHFVFVTCMTVYYVILSDISVNNIVER